MMTADMARERERRDWEREQERSLVDEEAEARRRKQKEVSGFLCVYCPVLLSAAPMFQSGNAAPRIDRVQWRAVYVLSPANSMV